MVLKLAYSVLIVILFFVLFYDVKKRLIHVILPVVIFVISSIINYMSDSLELSYIIYNLSFLLINIIGLTLYFSLKSKTLINPVDNVIGLGDIVFLAAITPLFNLKTFILFFVLGLVFSLLIHGFILIFKKIKTIPLAGYLSLFLTLNIVLKYFLKINVIL